MDISIIIVSWNVKEKLRQNLAELYKSIGDFSFEVFVVDNNSADNTVEMVKKEYPQVKLIINQENFGFSRANNQAIKIAQGRYILLLNPDMRMFDNTLLNMISWLNQHEKVWVAGCKLVDENANIIKHIRCFPTLIDQLAIILKIPHFFPAILNKYLRNDFDYAKSSIVNSIRGGFFMIRRQTVEKIGLLDERYFLWFEEVDYCMRVKQAGGEVWYMPTAECVDLVGQSFKQLDRGVTQRYFRDSMLKYFKKWRPVYEYWILKITWPIGMFIALIGNKLKIKSKAKT
ncbi:MAG: glycosyltransferase family 2 protein [Patescibacteria group bacterium]